MSLKKNRWFIATMATLAHMCLGTVYAWSFFQNPVAETFGWSNAATAGAFSLAIFVLGVTAAWGGINIDRIGSRKMAVIGSFLYASGYIISYFAFQASSVVMLYLGYGLVGGMGLGLVYVAPVATVSGWFPDKQGLATGMVVMGFGLGAFVMSKVLAPIFMGMFNNNLSHTFLAIGILLLVILPIFSSFLQTKEKSAITKAVNGNMLHVIVKPSYIFIWIMFMLNIVAGMIFLSFQSPLFQDLLKTEGLTDVAELAAKGATLIAVSAIFNGVGRFFWGAVSDKLGRVTSFRLIFIIEIVVFVLLIVSKSPVLFFIGVCIVLLCYGGGFGIVPALVKERYPAIMASVYGITLIGWGVGGIVGPQIVAYMRDNYGADAGVYSFVAGVILLCLGFVFSLLVKRSPETHI